MRRRGQKAAVAGSIGLAIWLAVPSAAQRTIEPADLGLVLSRIEPDPVVIEQTATLHGSGFGERGSVAIQLVSHEAGGAPLTPISEAHVRSWSDDRIELALPIRSEGRYGLRLARPDDGSEVLRRSNQSGISFDVVLPRPTITGYSAASVCPGQLFSIRGSGFTRIRGAFTILWDKTGPDRTPGITIRTERVTAWMDDQIRFRVPTDLPAYIAPGTSFRVALATRGDGGLRVRARGPEGRIPESCAGREGRAPTSVVPLSPTQQRGIRPEPASRPDLRVQPGIGPGGPMPLRFDLAPMPSRAVVGNVLVFGGTFQAGPALAEALRGSRAQVEWSIKRGSAIVRAGLVDVRGRSTPWLERVDATEAGTYRLEMRLLGGGPAGMTFAPNLSGAQVVVTAVANQVVDPQAGQAPGLPRGPLPPPRGLEPARP